MADNKQRTIFISDIHGCYDELIELLDKVRYNKEHDQLIFCGDYINRGPNSVAVVGKVKELVYTDGAKALMGNHENHFLRWYKGSQDAGWLKKRPHYAQFSQEDITFINNLPIYLEIKPNLYAIHAGVNPGTPMDKQRREQLLYLRYTDQNHNTIPLEKVFKDKVQAKFWTEFGPFGYSIIYGHAVFLNGPRIDKFNDETYCVGIDGGCCFGGNLQALIIKDNGEQEVVRVKAKEIYYKSKF